VAVFFIVIAIRNPEPVLIGLAVLFGLFTAMDLINIYKIRKRARDDPRYLDEEL
jgi:hypothetical protein